MSIIRSGHLAALKNGVPFSKYRTAATPSSIAQNGALATCLRAFK